jgi:hypothetical protein
MQSNLVVRLYKDCMRSCSRLCGPYVASIVLASGCTDTTDSSILVLWLQSPLTTHTHFVSVVDTVQYRYWVWGQWGLESEVEWYWSQFFSWMYYTNGGVNYSTKYLVLDRISNFFFSNNNILFYCYYAMYCS